MDPNTDGVGEGVDPNGFDDEAPKGDDPSDGVEAPNPGVVKVEVFGANGFEGVVVENGFAFSWVNAGEDENGFDCVGLVLNPIPPDV